MLIAVLQGGCQSLGPAQSRAEVRQLALDNGFAEQIVRAEPFSLFTLLRGSGEADKTLTIYIEGDGRAFISRHHVSANPTPRDPVALNMALADPAGKVAYLARPCQFIQPLSTNCQPRYWTTARYAEEVVTAMDAALDELKKASAAESITLVGYSGGATIATLLTQRRDDVDWLVTVAGNLDHAAWTAYHDDTPLNDSLNPITQIERLADIRQLHIAGGEDEIMPTALIADFVRALPAGTPVELLVFDDADHHDWSAIWQDHICDFSFRAGTAGCRKSPD